jgi:uncharacterized membrane protein
VSTVATDAERAPALPEAVAPEHLVPGPESPATAVRAAAADAGLRDRVAWLIALAVFAAYLPISLFRYLQRDPASWDLGIFTEYVKQYSQLRAPIVDIRGAGFDLLGDHFHPIVALLAPFFAVFPTPVTLLVAQALLAALSVIPVYRAGAELLGRGNGRAIGAAYGFSWGLQQLVSYDFHELAFAVPLLALSLSALVRGRSRAAVLWAMPLVLVKEDQGFTLAVIGLIIAIVYRRRASGLFLAGWGLLWSLLAMLVIIPYFNPDHVYYYWYKTGTLSRGVRLSPLALLAQLGTGWQLKLPTLALLLLVTGFLAVRSPLVLAVVPSLLMRFVSPDVFYWGTTWHYNAPLMPIVFIAAIDAMNRIRTARGQGRAVGRVPLAMERYGAAVMVAACAALAFQFPLSHLWQPGTYELRPQVAAENAAMALVPDGATVAATTDLLAPLAARTDTFFLANYRTDPHAPLTQYIVLTASSLGRGEYDPVSYVENVTGNAPYRVIFDDDGVYVLRLLPARPSPAGRHRSG